MANAKKAGIIIGIVMFAVVVSGLYAVIYAAPRIEGIGIKTEVVTYGQMPISDTVNALFVRDETLYVAAYSGNPEYMVAAGTKVRAGTQVAYIQPNNESPFTEQVVETLTETDVDLDEEDEIAPEETPIEKIIALAGGDTVVSEGGVSPYTAIVSYRGDGWEKKVTPSNIMSLPKSIIGRAPGESVNLTREWVAAGEPIYRITNNNLWRVAFWIDNVDKQTLDKYEPGRKVTLDVGTTKVRANVEVSEARGRDLFVVIRSDMYYRDLDKYRARELEVVFSEVSGAVIEKKSVKLKSGIPGVYVKQQSGTFKWVPVKVLKESGERYLIAETRFEDEDGKWISTIRYYDEIMSNPAGEGY